MPSWFKGTEILVQLCLNLFTAAVCQLATTVAIGLIAGFEAAFAFCCFIGAGESTHGCVIAEVIRFEFGKREERDCFGDSTQ